jgi:atypical dual specificity phosphatase
MHTTGAPPALTLHAYGVSFGARIVLAGLDLDLPADGIDVLMGPVKAGKSTLVRSLAGLTEGNALFRCWGEALVQGSPSWQRRPALVQQHAAVLNGSVRDAVIFHARQQAERSSSAAWNAFAQEALEHNGLGALVGHMDTPMLAQPLERQRAVNILSHALAAPPLLFVDEPTYGLQETAALWLTDWLAALGRHTRLLVVLHHQGQARRLADRVVLLGGGRVLAHMDRDRFFGRNENRWVEQFVRSGSLAIASPDARPEDLDPSVEPPPPLPAAALQAIASFKGSDPSARPVVSAASAPAPAPAQVSPPPAVAVHAPAPAAPAPVSPPPSAPRRLAKLPPLSIDGVAVASTVGIHVMPESRGPNGFHWIVPGRLAGCPEPGVSSPVDYDMDLLARMGITHLVTLTERDLDQATLARHGLTNIHLPIFDRESPSVRQTYMLLRRMQVLLDEGKVVAVHCKAGIGRTGTILAAWLIREGGLSADNAIARLRSINRSYVQTEVQEVFLHDFENDLLMRS